MPTVEIAHTAATEAYLASPGDPSLVQAASALLKSQDGCINVYNGLQVEDPKHAFLIIPWESLDHHKKLIDDKETYPVLGGHVSRIWADVPTVQLSHIETTSEPYKALEAPITELALFTVHEGASKAEVEKLVDKLSKAINALPESAGALGSAWGQVVEKDNQVGLFVGWTSVEAHQTAVTANPDAAGLIANIRKIADIKLLHIKLRQ